ncbi:thioredoxin [Portibacter lacus]|uniref:Thioredoxin n=1 Tax=Portibacter lacus TaxID=1099794 RepID=A0AA37WCU2_9BACT|nr:thioredoxin [Portibacter lacus]GLR15404.1 thioredoxin [Portibacter lacus]
MAFEFTDSNFQETALAEDTLAVVDFWAEWCGPCRMVTPIIEELSTDYEGKALIGKVNVDNNPEISMKYGVRSIPTILFIKNGEIVDKQVGATSKANLESKIQAHL